MNEKAATTQAVRALMRADVTLADSVRLSDLDLLRIPGIGARQAALVRELAADLLGPLVVTRHSALVELLRERGIVDDDAEVRAHVGEDDVRGRHVIGVLPLHLAALAWRVTEIPLALTPEDRGRELDIERLREIAGPAVTYKVTKVS